MHFLRGFKDEIIKTAGSGMGRMGRMLSELKMGRRGGEAAKGGMSMGRKALFGGGALAAGGLAGGAAGEVFGKKKGERQGYSEGTEDVSDIAQRARAIGREEGVMAYHNALQERLKQGGK